MVAKWSTTTNTMGCTGNLLHTKVGPFFLMQQKQHLLFNLTEHIFIGHRPKICILCDWPMLLFWKHLNKAFLG